MRQTGVELVANTLQASSEDQRSAQIRVAGNVRRSALDSAALGRNAKHVGAVVVAVADENRCPGRPRHAALAHQALVAVDGRRNDRANGLSVFQHPGNKVIAQLADTTFVDIVAVRLEQVSPGFAVGQRHVVVRTAAGAICRRLGHETGKGAMLAGDFVSQQAEEYEAVGHGERVGVLEICLELPVRVFVVE